MKMSLSWLKDFLSTSAPAPEIVDTLIQLGHEVDAVENEAAAFNNVVVGYVKERIQHPDADRLGICTVDVGAAEPKQIVCGAPNARKGITVAVALEGAVLPGDFKITKSKIRGVESRGMICSAKELNLGEDHDGIMELNTKAKIGSPIAPVFGKDDTILDIAVTPNRGDALSVYGLARDLAAAGLGTLKLLPKFPTGDHEKNIPVTLETPNCPAFTGIVATHVTNGASPAWLKQRISQAGLRPRNLGVDVTNYIMLTYGQPLHAYDADKLQGHIVVKDAQGGENFTGIGDVNITLQAGDMMVCDDSGMIALGGILGGESTAISETTTNIYLEAAYWNRTQIAKTGQAHHILTDARYRFERGVDIAILAVANQAAAAILVAYGGAQVSNVSTHGNPKKETATITYAPSFCTTFGGLNINANQQRDILTKLGFTGMFTGTNWQLTAPTWRTYMETPEDIVEEILRVIGYENIPAILPPQAVSTLPLSQAAPTLTLEKSTRRHLASLGFLETITYSFIDESSAKNFTEAPDILQQLDNPLDAETMTTMRPSLLPGLIRAAATNEARSTVAAQMAEVGTVFLAKEHINIEEQHAAGIFWPTHQRHWQNKTQKADIYSAKAAAISIINMHGVNPNSLQINTPASGWYHPGRSGQLVLGKTVLAEFGELHPALHTLFDLKLGKERLCLFTVNLTALSAQNVKTKAFITSDFPPVERDLAFVVDENVTAANITRTVQSAIKPLGSNVAIFDVYQGENMPAGKKSMAVSFTLQAPDKTLTDADINAVMQTAIDAVGKHYAGELRA